jgi:Luciferase-like monooxygenase
MVRQLHLNLFIHGRGHHPTASQLPLTGIRYYADLAGPQGRPLFVRAGSSEAGRRFAARYAEAVFAAQMEKATAKEFYAELKSLAAEAGRAPEQMLILPGLSPVIGSTEAEARRLARELNELSDTKVGRKRLSGRFGGHDFSHLPLDRPLAAEDFPNPAGVEAARSRTEVIVGLVRRERPTLRQLLGYLAGARCLRCSRCSSPKWCRCCSAAACCARTMPAELSGHITGWRGPRRGSSTHNTEPRSPMTHDLERTPQTEVLKP